MDDIEEKVNRGVGYGVRGLGAGKRTKSREQMLFSPLCDKLDTN